MRKVLPRFLLMILALACCACDDNPLVAKNSGNKLPPLPGSWAWRLPDRPADEFTNISAIDEDHWIAVGNGGAVLQMSGGVARSTVLGKGENLLAVLLFPNGEAIASAADGMVYSYDGGQWSAPVRAAQANANGHGTDLIDHQHDALDKCSLNPQSQRLVARSTSDVYLLSNKLLTHFDGDTWSSVFAPFETITDISLEGGDGALVVANQNQEIARLEGSRWELWDLALQLLDFEELHIDSSPGNNLYVLASGGTLLEFDELSWVKLADAPGNGFYAPLYVGPNQSIVAGRDRSYAHFDGNSFIRDAGNFESSYIRGRRVALFSDGDALALGNFGAVFSYAEDEGWTEANGDPMLAELSARTSARVANDGSVWIGLFDGGVLNYEVGQELRSWTISNQQIVDVRPLEGATARAVDAMANVFDFDGVAWSLSGTGTGLGPIGLAADGTPYGLRWPQQGTQFRGTRFVDGQWQVVVNSEFEYPGLFFAVSADDFYVARRVANGDQELLELVRIRPGEEDQIVRSFEDGGVPLQLYADANGCLSLSITQDLGNSSCGYSGPSSTHSRLDGSWASTLDLRLDDVAPWMDGSMVAVGFSPEGRAVFVRDANGWSPTQLPNVGFPPRGITANTNGKLWLHDRSRLIEYVE